MLGGPGAAANRVTGTRKNETDAAQLPSDRRAFVMAADPPSSDVPTAPTLSPYGLGTANVATAPAHRQDELAQEGGGRSWRGAAIRDVAGASHRTHSVGIDPLPQSSASTGFSRVPMP